MKKVLMSLAAVAAVFAGCQKPELEVAPVEVKDAFTASVENFDATKTALDGNHVVWSAADQLAIFQGFGVADLYEIADASAGSSSAKFVHKTSGLGDDFFGGIEMNDPRNVAFYPYAEGLGAYSEEGAWVVTNVTLPATQVYSENSFGNGAFPMVAVTETMDDHNLRFKNVLGAVKFQFTGSAVVKSIALKGNNGEVLAGKATVTAHDGFETPSVVLAEDGATEVVLDCGEGVQLSSEATNFVVALPPVEFEKGFTATVTYTNGKTYTVEATAANEVLRSGILAMPEVELFVSETLGDVTLITSASMTEVSLKVAIENAEATGFYGMFMRPEMWTMVQEYIAMEAVSFADILSGMMGTELPCLLYEGTTYTGKLSEFGIAPEYLEWDMYNMIQPDNSYIVGIVPVLPGKEEYTLADAQVFTVSTNSFSYGAELALPEYEVEEGYNTTTVTFAPSEEIAYAMYEYFKVEDGVVLPNQDWMTGEPINFPTQDNYIGSITNDAYYDSEEGFSVDVSNDYEVLPGVEYKLCVMLVDAAGKTALHIIDVKTLAIPYAEELAVSFDGAPEYSATDNSVWSYVNVPAGAVKLYYTFNRTATYTEYNAATTLVGILQGTTGFDFVDLTAEGAVVDGQVELHTMVLNNNKYGDVKMAVHVAAVDAEGNISQWTSSEVVTAPKQQ